jgi:uncharacterized protein|tara:strand:- start:1328 stop:2584 length:1257 start_codon:yes stop_codon:yes gene_type:complete
MDRIESLDVLRGFALLGILLVNIVAFGLVSSAFLDPGIYLTPIGGIDYIVWAFVELSSEGAMRALFSILFGAGVVLFATGSTAKSGWLHYRRNFWLLGFGLINVYIFLWPGDILVTYALSGFVLWFVRNWKARSLLILATFLILIGSLQNFVMKSSLEIARDAAEEMKISISKGEELSEETAEWAQGWMDYEDDNQAEIDNIPNELKKRTSSYASAYEYNLKKANELIYFVLPFFLFLDALMMMVIGMALFKLGVLDGGKEIKFYIRMMCIGFLIGISINAYEVLLITNSNMDIIETNPYFRFTYHFGRLFMGLGYLGLIILLIKIEKLESLRFRLACVGRMALTNYLMHSVIALFIFSGAGLGLLGKFSWSQLYLFVLLIWVLQLYISPLWLKYFYFGPVEWLWRLLTYLKIPKMVK